MKNEKPLSFKTISITRDRAKEYIHAHLATGTDLQLENILDSMLFKRELNVIIVPDVATGTDLQLENILDSMLFKRELNVIIVPDDFENDNCLL
jgi:hypothetical protein